MGWRFRKRFKIFPGVYINVGKKGINSVSVGPRGFTTNINTKGSRSSVDLPGGFSYQTKRSGSSTSDSQSYNYENVNQSITRTWRCERCGHLCPAENSFCGNCGTAALQTRIDPSYYQQQPNNTTRNSWLLLIGIVVGLCGIASMLSTKNSSNIEPTGGTAPSTLVSNSASPRPFASGTPLRPGAYEANRTSGTTSAAPLYSNPQPQRTPPRSSRFFRGPRGGCYYINGNGNKTYVDRSLCD